MGISPMSRTFWEKIKQYNSAFAFTSLAVNVDQSILNSTGPYSFWIHGQLHHNMGSLLPNKGHPASYAQLYIYDPDTALAAQNDCNPNLNPAIMMNLQAMLHQTHPYVPLYKQAYQIIMEKPEGECANVEVRIAQCTNKNNCVSN
jgi:hypothetical protein